MSKPFEVSQQVLQEIAQSLLEMKKQGRSLENLADAFYPLADEEHVKTKLETIAEYGREAARLSSELYRLIARAAMKGP